MRVAAYVYPGWHPIPERDASFHPGFTEWELVASCRPRFPGHAQPRVPALGAYDDRDPVDELRMPGRERECDPAACRPADRARRADPVRPEVLRDVIGGIRNGAGGAVLVQARGAVAGPVEGDQADAVRVSHRGIRVELRRPGGRMRQDHGAGGIRIPELDHTDQPAGTVRELRRSHAATIATGGATENGWRSRVPAWCPRGDN